MGWGPDAVSEPPESCTINTVCGGGWGPTPLPVPARLVYGLASPKTRGGSRPTRTSPPRLRGHPAALPLAEEKWAAATALAAEL